MSSVRLRDENVVEENVPNLLPVHQSRISSYATQLEMQVKETCQLLMADVDKQPEFKIVLRDALASLGVNSLDDAGRLRDLEVCSPYSVLQYWPTLPHSQLLLSVL
jgi:hypothetical protein